MWISRQCFISFYNKLSFVSTRKTACSAFIDSIESDTKVYKVKLVHYTPRYITRGDECRLSLPDSHRVVLRLHRMIELGEKENSGKS